MKNNYSKRYELSERHLLRAEKSIPLGSQTFSKSRTQYPVGISPLYIRKAAGSYVWDIDGNRYIDLVSSLASVTLGYGHPQVDSAVRKQLKKGVSYSLPGVLEAEVAELICELVPSAEMVRFGKNGSDATSAAVRLARAYTSKNRVVVCGYHGWQDWYIGSTTRNKGVPSEVSKLTSSFFYNNLESLREIFEKFDDIACVVMEPMNSAYPQPGFLEGVRELTIRYGAILIFDETVTGFRFSEGGAQELFGVIPDLSTFGKGIANGYPLSVVAGKRDIMMEMEEIFFSGTFGGELLSLAAAKVILQLHTHKEIVPRLKDIGSDLTERVNQAIATTDCTELLKLSGHPSWTFLNWYDFEGYSSEILKTYFMQEMFKNGVLVLGTHNVTTMHSRKIRRKIEGKYHSALNQVSDGVRNHNLKEKLSVEPLKNLFRVR